MQDTRKWAYLLYVITSLFSCLSIFLQVMPISTSKHFQDSLDLTSSEVVYITSIFFVTYALMQIPSGVLLDKYGLRYVLPVGIFITVIGCFLYWISTNTGILGLSRLIAGAGSAVAYIAGVFIAVKFLPLKWLPLFIGLLEAVSTSGSILAAKPLEKFLNKFGWNVTATVMDIFCVIVLIIAIICISKLKVTPSDSKISVIATFKQAFNLLKNRTLIAIFIYSFSTWLVMMSFAGFWLKDYLVYVHQYSESIALDLVQVYWVSFVLSSMLLSFVIKNLKTSKLCLLILSSLGCITYIIMAIPIVFNYTGTWAVVLFGGISATGVIVTFTIVPKVVKPEQSGAVISMNNMFIVLGGYVGQLLFGYVLKNIDITHILPFPPLNFETHYYSALLIYPLFTVIAFIAIIYGLFNKEIKSLDFYKC